MLETPLSWIITMTGMPTVWPGTQSTVSCASIIKRIGDVRVGDSLEARSYRDIQLSEDQDQELSVCFCRGNAHASWVVGEAVRVD
jgi:hypothetical protein